MPVVREDYPRLVKIWSQKTQDYQRTVGFFIARTSIAQIVGKSVQQRRLFTHKLTPTASAPDKDPEEASEVVIAYTAMPDLSAIPRRLVPPYEPTDSLRGAYRMFSLGLLRAAPPSCCAS